MRKNIHRQFLGFLCAVMCACSVAVPCFAADVAASDPEISFYMENINDAQCVLTVQNGKASASASVTGRRGAERCKIVLEIQKKQGFCRVSDISSYMNTTLPSITKLVQELEERNLLVKQADEKDKRVINLTLTEEGKEFVELRVTHFHGEWASRLPDLDDAVVDEFVHAITRMQETMPGIKGVKNNGKRK
mgnify:FL=1